MRWKDPLTQLTDNQMAVLCAARTPRTAKEIRTFIGGGISQSTVHQSVTLLKTRNLLVGYKGYNGIGHTAYEVSALGDHCLAKLDRKADREAKKQ